MLENKNDEKIFTRQPGFDERHKEDPYYMSPIKSFFKSYKWVIIFVTFIFIMSQFIVIRGIVPSGSMEPNINTGSFIWGNRNTYVFDSPKRGDVVIFKSNENGDYLVKRVIGLPGETITIKDGNIYVNDVKLIEHAYIKGVTNVGENKIDTFLVPDGNYFLLGDNRENSLDARFWNSPFIPEKQISGETFLELSLKPGSGFIIRLVKSIAPEYVIN